ncbi:hypothetical protein ACPF8X_08865 [Streptomyces sp. G35A]
MPGRSRPGARDALSDRLDVMPREQRYAAEHRAGLSGLLASAATREEAEALRLDLARAHDDRERATARRAEPGARLAALAGTLPGPGPAPGDGRFPVRVPRGDGALTVSAPAPSDIRPPAPAPPRDRLPHALRVAGHPA